MASEIIVKQPPNEEQLRSNYSPVIARADGIEVLTQDDHEDASLCFKDIHQAKNRVRTEMDPIISDANQVHKKLTSLRKRLLAPLELAGEIIKGKLDVYETEQRRIAEAATKKAEEEALEKEEERRLQEAFEKVEEGDDDEAAAILDEPVEAPVIKVEPKIAKVEGMSQRVSYKADVTDKKALICYVATHPQWSNLLDPNMAALNGLARSQKDEFSLPGVQVKKETVRAVRGS